MAAKAEAKPEKAETPRVVVALATVRMPEGVIRYLYEGDPVPEGAEQESVDHLRRRGFLSDSKK